MKVCKSHELTGSTPFTSFVSRSSWQPVTFENEYFILEDIFFQVAEQCQSVVGQGHLRSCLSFDRV